MIVIATHAVFLNGLDIYGPPHAVSLYLNKKKIDHIFIKHPLWEEGKTLVEYYKNGELEKKEYVGMGKRFPSIIHYVYEMILSIRVVLKSNALVELFIGVDPLNSLAGNFLKILGIVKKQVYFSADFAITRFPAVLLNTAYHLLDSNAMNSTNQTWSVSKRIVAYRQKKGLKKEKNLLLPNAPFFDSIKRQPIEKINTHDLVLVSALEKGIAFELLLDVIDEIRQKITDTRIIFIGSGSYKEKITTIIKEKKLEKNTLFLGALSHDEMFKVLVKSAIGVALYDDAPDGGFRYFSDPMKVRDYLVSGLPVVVSGNSGISEEIVEKEAGRHVLLEKEDIKKKLLSMLEDKKLYLQMRENAIELAKEYDTFALLENYTAKML